MGIRSAQVSEMVLSNVRVSADRMIAKPGEGFKLAMKTLDGGRIGVGAQALGIAEGAFDIAVKYLQEREQFGKPLFKQQYLAFKMAELYADIEKAKLVLYKAACLKEEGKPFTTAAAVAKLTCTDVAMKSRRNASRCSAATVHARISCRTHDARRKNHPNLRRHKRNPETGHFRRLVPS